MFEPVEALSVGLDVWRIDFRNKIVFADRFFVDNESRFPDAIVRAPAIPEDLALGIPAPIVDLRHTYINLADQEVRGADLDVKYRLAGAGSGRFTFVAVATCVDRFAVRTAPGGATEQRGGGDRRPRTKADVSLQWERGAWLAGLATHHVASFHYFNGRDTIERTIGSFTTFAANVEWRPVWGQLTLIVRNLADRAPPLRDTSEGFDTVTHDPRGRLVSIALHVAL